MSFFVTKMFEIKNPDYPNPNNTDGLLPGAAFSVEFYRYMIEDGVIANPLVTPENFKSEMDQIKLQYETDTSKVVDVQPEFVDAKTMFWFAVFQDEADYNDYKSTLYQKFNTDFNQSFETTNIKLVIS